MGFWDALAGRSKPVAPKMDGLFSLPAAAITLQASANFTMTGRGAICFRAAEGPAFTQTLTETVALLDNDEDPDVEITTDQYGFTWLLARQDDMGALTTDLHAVTSSLEIQGFSHTVLCTLVSFADPSGRSLALVYLYKQGTFYPFAPSGQPQQRDNILEIQVRDLLSTDLPVERDTSRWMALWGAPGL
jgi:hypothetical protein